MTEINQNPLLNLPTELFIEDSKVLAMPPDGHLYWVENAPVFTNDIELEWVQEPPDSVQVGDEFTVAVKLIAQVGFNMDFRFGVYMPRGYQQTALVSETATTTDPNAVIGNYGAISSRFVRKRVTDLDEGQEVVLSATFRATAANNDVRFRMYFGSLSQDYIAQADPDRYTVASKRLEYVT